MNKYLHAITIPTLILALIVLPATPQARAKGLSLPFYEVTWTSQDVTLYLTTETGGIVASKASDPRSEKFIAEDDLGQIDVAVLSGDWSSFLAAATIPNGRGELQRYTVSGSYEPSTETMTGTLWLDGGRIGEPFVVQAPGAGDEPDPNVVIVIIVGAAAAGAIVCGIVALATNCVEDCGDECLRRGGCMESATEGWCGRCTCSCYTPAECEDDDD